MVEIISIGDELLIGQTLNTNASWMAEQLVAISLNVRHISTVSDESQAIFEALESAARRVKLVLVTGGLGPTQDDLTKAVLCDYFNDKLVVHSPTLRRIEEYFGQINIELLDSNRSQAEMPSSCQVILNTRGTAQGMWFEKDGVVFVAMPGVPHEMKGMMREELLPRFKKLFVSGHIVQKSVLTVGVGESILANQVSSWEERAKNEGVSIAYLPSPGEVKIRLMARGEKREELESLVDRTCDAFVQTVGTAIYGYNHDTLAGVVGKMLIENGQKLATAESCTGGYLGHMITTVSGSSDYYLGGVISYANTVKTEVLGVDQQSLDNYGAVSEVVVKSMAEGARSLTGADWAIATSGVAGPEGGTTDKPVGLIWIAVAGSAETKAFKFTFGKSRARNILLGSLMGLNLLRLELLKIGVGRTR